MAVAAPRKVLNRRVRYESEYAASKKEGHAFFPGAMFHDVVINLVVVLVIVAMAVVWHATAGPIDQAHPAGQNGLFGALYEQKANPAVQATEPRPEWYFLFLFELLRIFKTPWQLIFATIIIPTIMMVLLVTWPFLDRGRDRRLSRRPGGVAVGLTVPAVLIALTMAGSVAPGVAAGGAVTGNASFDKTAGAELITSAGCQTCHNFGAGGGSVGPELLVGKGSSMFGNNVSALEQWISSGANAASGGVMPAYGKQGLTSQQIATIAQFVAALSTGKPPAQ
ncbi:MAG TPA: c-type cytochrome [Gaiellales bacterium]|nr:c-type cytochrome [Gaiellales bacterium]